jgi:pyruvate/2-oxoglutarate dehydrogenase complex dihydrolipoamide acyltransferase (E2) component
MPVPLKVPNVGESITEVEIGEWLKKNGEFVAENDPVVVIETEKATVELPAPVSGKLTEVIKKQGEKAAVGEVIGYMEEAAAGEAKPPEKKSKTKLRNSRHSLLLPRHRHHHRRHHNNHNTTTTTSSSAAASAYSRSKTVRCSVNIARRTRGSYDSDSTPYRRAVSRSAEECRAADDIQ